MSSPHDVPGDRINRRLVLKQEYGERKNCQWSPWVITAMPAGIPSKDAGGWLWDVDRVASNGWCVALIRACNAPPWGIVEHAAIRTASQTDLTWGERQRIKDEIWGPERTAIEVFPARTRLIDEAMMYHLWLLPAGMDLPFGLSRHDPCSGRHYRRA